MNILLLLDIVIGIVFLYVLLALVASSVNEAIATVLNSRAKWLRLGLESLFQGASKQDRKIKLDALLSSSAISHLGLANADSLPKIRRSDTDTIATSWPVDRLQSREFLHALFSLGGEEDALKKVGAGVANLPNNTPIRYAMDAILSSSSVTDIDQFHDAFDQWYERFQQQIRHWYARKTRLVLWAVSVVVVVALNADSILLIKTLGMNSETRESIVSLALKLAEKSEMPTLGTVLDTTASTKPPPASSSTPPSGASSETSSTEASADDAKGKALNASGEHPFRDMARTVDETKQLVASLSGSGLRLGWAGTDADWRAIPVIEDKPIGLFDWLSKVIGLLITAAAMTLGAPFWFDLLRDLRGLRTSWIKKKEASV